MRVESTSITRERLVPSAELGSCRCGVAAPPSGEQSPQASARVEEPQGGAVRDRSLAREHADLPGERSTVVVDRVAHDVLSVHLEDVDAAYLDPPPAGLDALERSAVER